MMWRGRMFLAALLAMGLIGCARTSANRDVIYMTSTIHALIEGLFDGEVSFGELKRHGDIGLGAVDSVDGELVMVDGVCYQVKADGTSHILADSQKTPYALATAFEPDRVLEINEATDFEQLKKKIDAEVANLNLPYAFRIEGTFSYVRARSVPRQNKPYPRLIEAINYQRQFEFQNVEGVIVGFRLPVHLESVGVPGYHFHFLTADRKSGGHLMEFRSNHLHVGADLSPEIHLVLPRGEGFARTDFTQRKQDEIDRIMGRKK